MTKKIKLMFDATNIADISIKNSGRSGIFFCCYHLIDKLIKRTDVDLSFYCKSNRQSGLRSIKEFADIPIYPKISFLDRIKSYARLRKAQAATNKNKLKKIFWQWLALFSHIMPS